MSSKIDAEFARDFDIDFDFALTRNKTLRKQSLCLVLLDHRQLSSGEIKTNYYKKEHILKRAAQAMRPSAMRKQK